MEAIIIPMKIKSILLCDLLMKNQIYEFKNLRKRNRESRNKIVTYNIAKKITQKTIS